MAGFIQRLLTSAGKPSELAQYLDDPQVHVGAFAQSKAEIDAAIAKERDIKVLKAALDRAQSVGDLRFVLLIGDRLAQVAGEPDVMLYHVRNLLWAKQLSKAETILADFTPPSPTYPLYLEVLFIRDLLAKRLPAAKVALNELAATSPGRSASLKRELGQRMMELGQYDDALTCVVQARQDHPDDAGLIQLEVRLCLFLEGPQAALARLETFIDVLGPSSTLYRQTYGEILLQRGRFNEVFDLLSDWIAQEPKTTAYYYMAQSAATQCDRTNELVALVDQMQEQHPRFRDLDEMRCNLAVDMNDWAVADEIKASIKPRNRWAHRAIEFAEALQKPLDQDPAKLLKSLRDDGFRFIGPVVMLALYNYYYRASDETLKLALEAVEDHIDESYNDPGLITVYLRLLVATGRDPEARAFWKLLPRGMVETVSLAPFAMYFDAREGEHDKAAAGWRKYLSETAHMAINARSSYPAAVNFRAGDLKPEDVLLFLTVFNGIEYVAWFLKYYRDLGVGHFFIIDNGSDDGTFEYLAEQNDVSLFQNKESFAASACGVFWVNHLMRRYGVGHWCLHVDMDEAFVFPGMDEGTDLPTFLRYLDEQGHASVPSIMLDIYPEKLELGKGEDPFAASAYFDTDYVFVPNELPPYTFIQGGIRARMSGRSLLMTKAPLVKMTKDLAYISNNHQHTHVPFSEVGTALLHYKFIGDFPCRIDEAISRQEHFMGARFYKSLRESVASPEAAESGLLSPFSKKYAKIADIVDAGLISDPNGWRNYRQKQADG